MQIVPGLGLKNPCVVQSFFNKMLFFKICFDSKATGDEIITSYFSTERPDAIQQTRVKGLGWMGGFFLFFK